MTEDGGMRRMMPPPRRRPGVFTLVIRWRAEILLGAGLVVLGRWLGPDGLGATALAAGALIALVPACRRAAVGLLGAMVVPHRVRSGLVQAGVADRDGRLPWLVWARPVGEDVLVDVWLRAGTTVRDIEVALPVLAVACGAAKVEVVAPPLRPDRALLVVCRPRWGWPTSR